MNRKGLPKAPTLTWILVLNPPPRGSGPGPGLPGPLFEGRSGGAGMGPHHGAVDDEVFHIRVGGEMLMQQFPDTPVGPAGKPFVDAVPIPILGWEEPPLGPGAVHPEDGFYETPALKRRHSSS